MRSYLVLAILFVAVPACPQASPDALAGAAVPHVVTQTEPVYPPIAKAAHVSGEVQLNVQIGRDGHVIGVKPISGPPMLIGAAEDCVKQWVYEPILIDGTPGQGSTIVTIKFGLPAPVNPNDEQIAQKFFPLHQACIEAVSSNTDADQQANLCKQAAEIAQSFSDQERFIERRSAFVYASTALVRDKQFKIALDYANRAVAVVNQGHDDGAGSSAAFSVRAQAEALLGDLPSASADLTKSEDLQRSAIASMNKMDPDFVKHAYVPTLKGLLRFHAQVLSAMGDADQAKSKTAEADSL
jgi:TonB-like protein